jgi:hypothetical protein
MEFLYEYSRGSRNDVLYIVEDILVPILKSNRDLMKTNILFIH